MARTWEDGTPINPRTVIERLGKPTRHYCRCAPNGYASGNIRVSDGLKATFEGVVIHHCPKCKRYWKGTK
jgi:hypothetical protein